MAIKYFIGSGDNFNDATKWSTTSGGANDTTAPTSSDVATFDSNSGDCTFSANVSIAGIDMQASYASIITQGTYTYTIGTSKHIQAGGTFTGGSGAITFNGHMNLNGGHFQSTSGLFVNNKSWYKTGGTFAHNNGSYKWDSNGHYFYESNDEVTFYKMELEKGVYDLTTTGGGGVPPSISFELLIDNSFSSSPALFGAIKLVDDCALISDGGLFGSGDIQFYGVNHTWTVMSTNSKCALPDVDINCNSLTFVEGVPNVKFGFRQWTWTDGTLIDLDDKDLYFAHEYNTQYFKLKGLMTFRDLTFANNTNNNDFYIRDLASSNIGEIQLRNFTKKLSSGAQNFGGTVYFSGDWTQTNNAPTVTSNCVLEMNGTGDQVITKPSGRILASSLVVNKPSGAWKLIADFSTGLSGFDVAMNAGEIDLAGFNLTINDQLVHTAGLIHDTVGGGTLTLGRHIADGGTINLDNVISSTTVTGVIFNDAVGYVMDITTYTFTGSANFEIDQLNTTFNNVTFNKGSSSYSGVSTIDGKFILTAGDFVTGSIINLKGDIEINDTVVSNGLEMLINGDSDQTIYIANGDSTGINSLAIVNKLSGKVSQLSDFGSASIDFILLRGVWCTNDFDFNVNGLSITNANAEFQKTTASTVTTTTTTGTITNVTDCAQKKTNFFSAE